MRPDVASLSKVVTCTWSFTLDPVIDLFPEPTSRTDSPGSHFHDKAELFVSGVHEILGSVQPAEPPASVKPH